MLPEQEKNLRFPLLALGVTVIIVLTAASYSPALKAEFIWDDNWLIYENPCIKADRGLLSFWFPCAEAPEGYNVPDYFPVTFTTLWAEWRLRGMGSGGHQKKDLDRASRGFHATNVVLHAVAALLVWWVLAKLKIPGAWLAGLIFAVHPVNVASVAWVSERKNTVSIVFYLLTFIAWLNFEDKGRWGWYAGAIVLFALALLSKTSVVTLPVVLLGLAWWRRGRLDRRDLLVTLPLLVMSAMFGVVTIVFQRGVIETDVVRPEGALSRLAAAGWSLWFYFGKVLRPVNLAMIYPRWDVDPAWAPAWIPLLALIGCVALCVRFRKAWGRPFLFVIGYYVVTLLPVLGVFDAFYMKYSLVADHWQHLSIVAMIALVVGLQRAAVARKRLAVRVAAFCSMGIAVAGLCALTWRQAGTYKNVQALWEHTLRLNPRSSVAHTNYGSLLAGQGRLREAAEHYARSIELTPEYALAYCNLGTMQFGLKMPREALKNLRKSIEIEPKYYLSHWNLGKFLILLGRHDEGIGHLSKAVEIKPHMAEVRRSLGEALLQRGRYAEAAKQFTRLLELSGDDANAHWTLGVALGGLGRAGDAERHFRQALRIDPNHVPAHSSLGALLAITGRLDQAESHLLRAVQLDRNCFDAHRHLAMVLVRKGRVDAALKVSYRALQIRADHAGVMNIIARIRATWPDAKLRDAAEAVRLAERACRLTGRKNPALLDTLAAAYAEGGRFDDAVKTAAEALVLATSPQQGRLADGIRERLKLYTAARPYREKPGP